MIFSFDSWNEVIGGNVPTMKKVKLCLKDKILNYSLEESQRKYQNLLLSGINVDMISSIKLKRVLKNIKNLEMRDVSFSNNETFIKFFKDLETVKNVRINSCGCSSNNMLNFRILELEKFEVPIEIQLKFDTLHVQCDNIFNNILIENIGDQHCDKIFNPLEFLISNQQNLKCLIIDSPSYDPIMNSGALKAIFKILCENYGKLKTLEILAITMRTSRYQTNFIDFLKCYGGSLKVLKMTAETDSLDFLSPKLLETIQNDMKLVELSISVDDLFCDVEEWMEIRRYPPQICCNSISPEKPNVSLKVLEMDKVTLSSSEKFFRCFPEIECLTLDLCSKSPRQTKFFLGAVHWLKKLKVLRVPCMPDIPHGEPNLNAPSLRSIFFKYYPEGFSGKGIIGKRNCESCRSRLQKFLHYCSNVFYQSFVTKKSFSMVIKGN